MSVWSLEYEGIDPAQEPLREALCTLGNGSFATRGAADDSVHCPGTYVAGCFNRLTTDIAGHTIEIEDIVNVPNWLVLNFRLEGGDWFEIQQVDVLAYRQELDQRADQG